MRCLLFILSLLVAWSSAAQLNLRNAAYSPIWNVATNAGGGGGGFTPSDYGTVQVWYSARVGGATNVPNNTGTNKWYDLSGNQYDALQSASINQPNRVTNGMNGVAAWAFTGNATPTDTSYMVVSNCLQSLTAATLIVSLQITNDPAIGSSSSGFGKFGSDSVTGNHWPFTDGTVYDGFGITSRVTVGNPSRSFTNAVVVAITVTANSYHYYVDNVEIGSGSASCTVGWTTIPWLGRHPDTPAGLSGCITDFVIYNAVLSTQNRTNANNALGTIVGSQIN